MTEIRKATPADEAAVCRFYQEACADLETQPYSPRWSWGLYPSEEHLHRKQTEGSLYLALVDGEVAAAMILDHTRNERYDAFAWPCPLAEDGYLVLHTLCVGARWGGQGLGKRMCRFIQEEAVRQGMKAIRLDVLKGNLPAERLYLAAGFTLMGTLPMEYSGCGMVEAELYEWLVPSCRSVSPLREPADHGILMQNDR